MHACGHSEHNCVHAAAQWEFERLHSDTCVNVATQLTKASTPSYWRDRIKARQLSSKVIHQQFQSLSSAAIKVYVRHWLWWAN